MKKKDRNLGYLEGVLSSIINTILFILKLWVGMMVGSVAMIADAWHTLSDTLTSLVVIIGFWISGRPSDREHPFGHGRAELIGALIIGTLLGVVGVNFFKESVMNLFRHVKPPTFTLVPIIIFALSIAIKEAIAQFSMWAGKKINSRALIADAWHHRSDAIASALIVLGALFGKSLWWIDGVMGIGVSLLILWAAFDVVRSAADDLMGEDVDPVLSGKIQALITEIAPDITHVHHLHVHRYGQHREITLHIRMDGEATLNLVHEVASRIETRLRSELDVEVTVHAEPCGNSPEKSTGSHIFGMNR